MSNSSSFVGLVMTDEGVRSGFSSSEDKTEQEESCQSHFHVYKDLK